MPPYTPLATPAVKLPDWYFNPQFQELDPAISAQRQVDAQGIANQNATTAGQVANINLQELQRKNESDMAVRAALQKYVQDAASQTQDQTQATPEIIGQNADQSPIYGDTPTNSNPTNSNPGGLNIKQLSDAVGNAAAGAGDYTTALAAAKAGKDATGDRVLTPEELNVLNAQGGPQLAAGSTVKDAQLLNSFRNANTSETNVTGKQNRFDKSFGNKVSLQTAPGIFSNDTDENGNPKPIDTNQKKNLIGIQSGLDTIVRNGDALVSHLANDKLSIGDKLQVQKQEIANMMPALRALDNQGVRFNEFIKSIDINQIGNDAELADRIVGSMVGQDPAQAVSRFIAEVVHQSQVKANANNAYLDPNKISNFDPATADLYQKYSVYSRGQPKATNQSSIPKASSALTSQPVPLNPDGSVLTKEQFLAQRNK